MFQSGSVVRKNKVFSIIEDFHSAIGFCLDELVGVPFFRSRQVKFSRNLNYVYLYFRFSEIFG